MELKGSRTEANLMTAFAGESQARNKYTYFASVAKKEGFEQISAIFQKTADNQKDFAFVYASNQFARMSLSDKINASCSLIGLLFRATESNRFTPKPFQ